MSQLLLTEYRHSTILEATIGEGEGTGFPLLFDQSLRLRVNAWHTVAAIQNVQTITDLL